MILGLLLLILGGLLLWAAFTGRAAAVAALTAPARPADPA